MLVSSRESEGRGMIEDDPGTILAARLMAQEQAIVAIAVALAATAPGAADDIHRDLIAIASRLRDREPDHERAAIETEALADRLLAVMRKVTPRGPA
jgi:hypothetical protein